jgi:hypothetical protein
MELKFIRNIAIVIVWSLLASCNHEDDDTKTLLGGWRTSKADFQINLIRISRDNLNIMLDFKSDGKLIYTDDTQALEGHYTFKEKKLTISGIDTDQLPISISQTYDVQELRSDKLIIAGKQEGIIHDPQYGEISGTVKATFYFDKVAN